jgi:hypothetical protein
VYWRDHHPPHFHAEYGEYEVLINIQTLSVYDGQLSRRALSHVLEWAAEHQKELLENWELCRNRQHPHSIQPLE